MNLDPMISMALAVHQHPNRYALLLGSGISRSAQIPTGWEVVIDLIRRLAKAEGEDLGESPVNWFRDKYGIEPDYSALVEGLAKTQEERQSLLKQYFEPANDDDRENEIRRPTAAHQAIAQMAKDGCIRVIVTTNFDRLMEDALAAEGIHPSVLASEDAIKGMVPIEHGGVFVVKLHGDYLDARIRNTANELDGYESETQSLLDQIRERFGLIVAGWSGESDTALRDAITRTTRYRYSTFWMSRGEPSNISADLIQKRDAIVVPIADADDGFTKLAEKVAALNSGLEADPISPAMALQTAKRYVADSRFDIRYHDLLFEEVERVRSLTNRKAMPWYYAGEDFGAAYVDRVKKIETVCSCLVPIIASGVYHGGTRFDEYWPRVITRLAWEDDHSGGTVQTALERLGKYPAVLLLYTIGICALAKGRFDLLRVLLAETKFAIDKHSNPDTLCHQLSAPDAFYSDAAQLLHRKTEDDKTSTRYTPGSDHIHESFWPMLQPILLDLSVYEEHFDQFEVILGLLVADAGGHVPYGRFYWKSEPLKPLGTRKEHGPLAQSMLQTGFFGSDKSQLFDAFDRILSEGQRRGW